MASSFLQVLLVLVGLLANSAGSQAGVSELFKHLVLRGTATWQLHGLPELQKQEGEVSKVKVDFYEESLCPYCGAFIRGELKTLFTTGLIDIVDLRLIPYGNAKVLPDGTILCQHGPLECTGNLIEACAVDLYPTPSSWYPFVDCLAGSGIQIENNAEFCAKETGLDFETIKKCYQGPEGDKLVRKFGKETDELQPPHFYVPWLVVDGVPAYEDYDQVASLVCQAYKGQTPGVCKDFMQKRTKSALAVTKWTLKLNGVETDFGSAQP